MATLSDRQKVLAHLVEVGAKFENPKDLLTYLAIQGADRRSVIRDQREYVSTLVGAGYESKLARTFFDDYKSPSKTVTAAAKKSATSEPVVTPDPPQDLNADRPDNITDEPV